MWQWSLTMVMVGGILASGTSQVDDPRAAIDAVLTDFHAAASEPDSDRYFGHFTEDAIFYGTDPGERWTVEAFRAYAKPIHDQGRGWTYHLRARAIFVGPGGDVAWFDEIVESDHYGACRGTGALVKQGRDWKIAQYNLVIPVPNAFADQVVLATQRGLSMPKTIVFVRHAEKEAGRNPSINAAGQERLRRLQAILREHQFDAVFSTDFNRTRESAAPFAEAAEVEISLFDPRDNEGLAEQLRSEQSGRTALVVGHSNTLGPWMSALGVDHDLAIDESEYDHLLIVHLDELGRATMTHLHF